MRHLFIVLISFLSCGVIFSQETSVFSEINAHYKEGLRLFSEGVYVAARKEFETVLKEQRLSFEPEYKTLHLYAEYYSAISASMRRVIRACAVASGTDCSTKPTTKPDSRKS